MLSSEKENGYHAYKHLDRSDGKQTLRRTGIGP
jgi:hypothetical protein